MSEEKTTRETPQAEESPAVAEPKPKKAKSKAKASKEERPSAETEQLKKELSDKNDQLLRIAAEYDNFRRRSQKEKESLYADSKVDVLKELLPVIDNLERAIESGAADVETYSKGVQMTFDQMMAAMGKLGVEQYGAPGDDFDPQFHNAVMHMEDDSLGEQKIVEVFQKGYRHGEKVLRPAMVKVAN